MEEVQVEDWKLKINVEKTRQAYETIPHKNEPIEWLNYLEVCSFVDSEIIEFFERLGMDVLKPSSLSYLAVEEGTMMMYTGVYYVHGEIVAGEMDGWDLVIGQHCFSLTAVHDNVPTHMQDEIVEIGFEAVLPWIL